ncbi:hypothetical protein SCUCBS95973_003299 [Sporothrix curviconia]|uniref:FAD/NAD(P)-binding domain-containing protein n=1 Tax=Sporothrix curviconia TaxID=1260050 RepID=A0ABP0BEE9_9PEZI
MAFLTNGSTNGANGTNGVSAPRPAYAYSKQPLWAPRPIRVVVIGCGVTSIAAVKLFKDRFLAQGKPVELVLYEKNTSVGGIWFENRYPGCSCDVPSHTYTYSWEGNPYWSRAYVGSDELYEYFEGRAKAYGVYDYVKLQHKAEVVINATGFFVPQVQPVAKHLYCFYRSPAWISPELAEELAPQGRDTVYSKEQQDAWANDPDAFLKLRKRAAHILNDGFDIIVKGSAVQKVATEQSRELMKTRLARRPELIDKLTPKFALGCCRFTPGHGYLEALCEDNTTVLTQNIKEVTATGITLVDGTAVALDVLICATGFNTSFCPPFTVVGENGAVLNDAWKTEPTSYMGIAAVGFPYYFMTSGPNSPSAHGTLIGCLETYIHYAFAAVDKLMTENVKKLAPQQAAVDDFQEHKDDIVKDLVWTSGCRSWYKNGAIDGKVWGPWPGSGPHFLEFMLRPRWEDWQITYRGANRFQFLGNGKAARELEKNGDLAWLITQPGAKAT